MTEPSGALALAGLKRYIADNDLINAGKRFVVVVSGANMNFGRLRFVAERAELGEKKEVLFSAEIPDLPGRSVLSSLPRPSLDLITKYPLTSFIALHTIIHPRAVTEFTYRWTESRSAHIFLSFILASTSPRAAEVAEVLDQLKAKGMVAHDISDDEFAKDHARYMVGGASNPRDERVFRFRKLKMYIE